MIADGNGPGEVQKQANNAYRQLTPEEKEELRKVAEEKNCDPTDVQIPRQRLIRKIVANIHANVRIQIPSSVYTTLFKLSQCFVVQIKGRAIATSDLYFKLEPQFAILFLVETHFIVEEDELCLHMLH